MNGLCFLYNFTKINTILAYYGYIKKKKKYFLT